MVRMKDLDDCSPEIRKNAIRRISQFPAGWIFISLLLFISAGTVKWTNGWLFMGILVLVDIIGLPFISLEVLAERGSRKKNVEEWDIKLSKCIGLSMLGVFLVAGLDYRWRWTQEINAVLQVISAAVFVLGCALQIWAMSVNRFFSDAVRIQQERGHRVCSTGPYRYIRHPGYLGMIVYYLAAPILLGSIWAIIPAAFTIFLIMIRTHLEDKTLIDKLPGYKEYTLLIRYRLMPGVW